MINGFAVTTFFFCYSELSKHLEISHLKVGLFDYECLQCERKTLTIYDFNIHFISCHLHHCMQCLKCKKNCIKIIEIDQHNLDCSENIKLAKRLEKENEQMDTQQSRSIKCQICNKNHFLQHCEKFTKMTAIQRTKFVKGLNLCYKCLKKHKKNKCKLNNCENCKGTHNLVFSWTH